MEQSANVRETMLRFYDRLSAGDVGGFDELVSQEPATLVIGTASGERVNDRAGLRFGFEAEGVRIEAGDPLGYEEGSLGWVVDEPTFFSLTAPACRRVSQQSCIGRTTGGSSCTCTSPSACLMRRWSSYRRDGQPKENLLEVKSANGTKHQEADMLKCAIRRS